MSEINKINTQKNSSNNIDTLDKFKESFDGFLSDLKNGNIEKSSNYIEKVFKISNLEKLNVLTFSNKIDELFSDFSFLDKPILYIYGEDTKADIIYKIGEYFEKKGNNKKSLEFLEFAEKLVENIQLKKDIEYDIKVLKSRLKKEVVKKEENNFDKLFNEIKDLTGKIKNLKKFTESDLKNSNLNISETNNKELLETQKKLLESLGIDASSIENHSDLKSQINKLINGFEEKIGEINIIIKKTKIKKKVFSDKIEVINKEIKQVKIDFAKITKRLEQKVKNNNQNKLDIFKNENYFKGKSKEENNNNSEGRGIRDESIGKKYKVNNESVNSYGFDKENKLVFSKKDFIIDGIKGNILIPQNIKIGYSENLNSKSKEYIGKLKSFYNKTEGKIDINFYEEIKEGTKIHKLNIPEGYKVSTNNIFFSKNNITYNIVNGDLGITYLLFEPELKENTKIKIGLIENNKGINKEIETNFNKPEIGKNLNQKNKLFLDDIDSNLTISEKIKLVQSYIRDNSYYIAGGIDLKNNKENLIWKVENLDLKNGKRPLICNLANNQFSAYLSYLGIKSIYITGLASSDYGTYSSHGWLKYYDGKEWIKSDATPDEDPNSNLQTDYGDKNINQIKKEEKKKNKIISEKKIEEKPFLKKEKELQKEIHKSNIKITEFNSKIKDLEKVLSPERKEDIETTIKNSDFFQKSMKDFGIIFLKNIQSLKAEQNKLETHSIILGKNILYDAKLVDKEKTIKLEDFNKKLYPFLENTVTTLSSALNNESLDFGKQYTYLITLTSLLKNFRKEVFEIDKTLSKKLDIIKNKIKNESLFLDEITNFPKLSYIQIGDSILIKKGKFDFNFGAKINKDFHNGLYTFFRGGKKMIGFNYNSYLGKNGIKKLKIFKSEPEFVNFNYEKEIYTNKLYYSSEHLKEIMDNPVNDFKKKQVINNLFIEYSYVDSIKNINGYTEGVEKHIYYDTFFDVIYKGDKGVFKNFIESIGEDKMLFATRFQNAFSLNIKDKNFKTLENKNPLFSNDIIAEKFIISGKYIMTKNINPDNDLSLYKVNKNSIEMVMGKNEIKSNLEEIVYFLDENAPLTFGKKIEILKLGLFIKNTKVADHVINKINETDDYNFNVGEVIKGEDGCNYTIITTKNNKYIFRNDGKLIHKTNISYLEIKKVDNVGNVFMSKGDVFVHYIIKNNSKIIKYKSENPKKISFNSIFDENKIEYQAEYTEKEYIKEFENLLKRKKIIYFDNKDFEFVINRMKDFSLNISLEKKYEEVLIKYNKKENKINTES